VCVECIHEQRYDILLSILKCLTFEEIIKLKSTQDQTTLLMTIALHTKKDSDAQVADKVIEYIDNLAINNMCSELDTMNLLTAKTSAGTDVFAHAIRGKNVRLLKFFRRVLEQDEVTDAIREKKNCHREALESLYASLANIKPSMMTIFLQNKIIDEHNVVPLMEKIGAQSTQKNEKIKLQQLLLQKIGRGKIKNQIVNSFALDSELDRYRQRTQESSKPDAAKPASFNIIDKYLKPSGEYGQVLWVKSRYGWDCRLGAGRLKLFNHKLASHNLSLFISYWVDRSFKENDYSYLSSSWFSEIVSAKLTSHFSLQRIDGCDDCVIRSVEALVRSAKQQLKTDDTGCFFFSSTPRIQFNEDTLKGIQSAALLSCPALY
jgi:hypothetical protein